MESARSPSPELLGGLPAGLPRGEAEDKAGKTEQPEEKSGRGKELKK